jgi:pimeloyl-ACP methyl ester carboxylesterase
MNNPKLRVHPKDLMIISKANPVTSFDEALRRIEAERKQDQAKDVRQICLPRVLEHGSPAAWAVVIFHGLTNCPEQFQEFGQRLFELGFNVYIPRQPYHGLADRAGNNLRPLTAAELAVFSDRALDIGHGLGRRLLVTGLSGGGTIAAWLAQYRPDLDLAMPMAAMLGLSFVPSSLTRPFAWLINHLPDFYMWWDPRTKADNPHAVDYSYPGYSVHAMSELLKLGVQVRKQAHTAPPAAKKIVMVINDNEPGVNNQELFKVLADWEAHKNQTVLSTFHFERELKLPHDIITPGTPGVDIEIVYERLINLILQETVNTI